MPALGLFETATRYNNRFIGYVVALAKCKPTPVKFKKT